MPRMRRAVPILVFLAVLAAAPAARACNPVPALEYSTGGAPDKRAIVDDPLFDRQWGLEQIHAPAAWARGHRGRGAIVAILDSGIDLTHPDLRPAMLEGVDLFARVSGRADCPPGPEDDTGHGTHVAGIAAAVGNNGIGVAGVAPEASILPIQVGDANGSRLDAVIDGIRYAADAGADVANASIAQGESPALMNVPALEADLEAAVEYAWERGTVVVGAAGNGSLPLCYYPGGARRAVCVTASTVDGVPASYSNDGAEADGTVTVRAPGGGGTPGTVDLCTDNIMSTIWPRSTIRQLHARAGRQGLRDRGGHLDGGPACQRARRAARGGPSDRAGDRRAHPLDRGAPVRDRRRRRGDRGASGARRATAAPGRAGRRGQLSGRRRCGRPAPLADCAAASFGPLAAASPRPVPAPGAAARRVSSCAVAPHCDAPGRTSGGAVLSAPGRARPRRRACASRGRRAARARRARAARPGG